MDVMKVEQVVKVVKDDHRFKLKKSKTKLILSDDSSDEDVVTETKPKTVSLSTKRRLDLKEKIMQIRHNVIHDSRGHQDIDGDDFADEKRNHKKTKAMSQTKANNEINEIMALIEDIHDCKAEDVDEDIKPFVAVVETNESLLNVSSDLNVSENTRSKSRSREISVAKVVLKKTANKMKTKKKRKSGKKSTESINSEQKMFEALELMDANESIEVLEDINSLEMHNMSLNVSQDMEAFAQNRDIEIKIKYKSVVNKFVMKASQQFSEIMPSIAETFNEDIATLVLQLNDRIIGSESTPQAIDLKVSDIVVCYKRSPNGSSIDPNLLSIKLKDNVSKSAETITVSKFDKISKIIEMYSSAKGLSKGVFRLEFDGDRLDPNKTVTEHDIEDDSQIDVICL